MKNQKNVPAIAPKYCRRTLVQSDVSSYLFSVDIANQATSLTKFFELLSFCSVCCQCTFVGLLMRKHLNIINHDKSLPTHAVGFVCARHFITTDQTTTAFVHLRKERLEANGSNDTQCNKKQRKHNDFFFAIFCLFLICHW